MDRLDFLSDKALDGIAAMVLSGVLREYPHQPGHVVMSKADMRTHRTLHPAFFGCYDWHSAVHSHWTLLKLLELAVPLPNRHLIRDTMTAHLSVEAMEVEAAYFELPGCAAFERPYGWAWIWKLSSALASSPLPEAPGWLANIRPLADSLAEQFSSWLERQSYPCRAGTHGNTAFAMGFGLEFAEACVRPAFAQSIADAAIRLFGNDQRFTLAMEPSGNDFISPMLSEICLMGRLLPGADWRAWLIALLPAGAELHDFEPVVASDRADAQGVHLDGLNLSRAYHLAAMGKLCGDDRLRQQLAASASRHWHAGMRYLFSGDFLGEHWLGSFAVLAALEMAALTKECSELPMR